MMIDFALEAERSAGKSPREAIYEACVLRLHPIMMTTMAALLAGLPLALGSGTPVPSYAARWASPSSAACADAFHHAGGVLLHRPPAFMGHTPKNRHRRQEIAPRRLSKSSVASPFRAEWSLHLDDHSCFAGIGARRP